MLEHIRVIEMAGGLAVPVAGLLLAECGANVVKVEPPGGEPDRADASFATWNRSKRSVVVDVSTAEGQKRLRGLLGEADIFLHDLSPERARAMRLDDTSLAADFPALIICSVLGYPAGHRDAERPTDELLVMARAGICDELSGYRAGPIVQRYPAGGWGAAHLAAAGVLTRLITRRQTGRGGAVHTSLLQGMLAPMALVWSRAEKGPLSMRMPKMEGPVRVSIYLCAGGNSLQIMDPTGKLDFASLPLMWEVANEHGLDIDNPEHRLKAFTYRPMDAWLKELRAANVAVEPALALGEVLRHPEAAANHYVVDVDDPVWGATKQAGTPFHLSDPVKVRGPAPSAGAHDSQPWSTARKPAASARAAPAKFPLDGMKVVDFGAFLAGPMAPSMLGDLGADVIKVEQITGDRMRFMTRYFQVAARNKRSIAIDLQKPQAQEILTRLVKWADVVHHNMRLKAASKMGLDEAGVRRHNPDVIFSYASAYGQKGERGNWPGYDSIFEAIGGWEVENAGEGNPPIFMRAGNMDVLCALSSLVATLLAVYARDTTGKAASAETSLLGIACLTQSETLLMSDGRLAPFARLDQAQTGTGPLHRIYQTSDGWVAIAARAAQTEALCAAFGASAIDALETAAKTRTNAALLDKLAAAGIAAEAVLTDALDKVFDDEAHKTSQVIVGYQHPEGGFIEQPGAYWTFGDFALRLDEPLPPPLLGEHTKEIMTELGYSADEIAALLKDGIILG